MNRSTSTACSEKERIAKMYIFLYNTLMRSSKIIFIGIIAGIMLPLQGIAYFTPEDVLLSKEFFLPPTAREGEDRIERQVTTSTERREREQDIIFDAQHVAELRELGDTDLLGETLNSDETLRAAAPGTINVLGGLDASDLELLQTIQLLQSRENRLLNRVNTNQQVLQYYGNQPNVLHGGAPLLAPTGAGGILAAVTMVGAVLWTLRRAHKAERAARASA